MRDKPWILIVIGFVAFVGALSVMVTIAVKNRQPDVPIAAHGH